MRPPLLYGHRGACAEFPENTMASFQRAVDVGVDVIESDVHMTRDGVVVMAHDESGRRMAGTDALIRDLTYDEVFKWDVGFGFVNAQGERPFAEKGMHIPKLVDVLSAFPDMQFNLDVKQEKPPMVSSLMGVLTSGRAMERVTLASFSSTNMRQIRKVFNGPTVLGRNEILTLFSLPRLVLGGLGVMAKNTRAQVPERAGPFVFRSRRFIDRAHALGIPVEFWTINDPELAGELLALGADGIMTDDPQAIRPAFAANAIAERP